MAYVELTQKSTTTVPIVMVVKAHVSQCYCVAHECVCNSFLAMLVHILVQADMSQVLNRFLKFKFVQHLVCACKSNDITINPSYTLGKMLN